MAITVEVAALGDPVKAFTPEAFAWPEDDASSPLAVSWDERPRATLDVEADEFVTDVLARAADALGVEPFEGSTVQESVSLIAFDDPDEPLTWRAIARPLILVDDDGRAVFNVWDLRNITYGEILRASDAGTLHGNPHRPYLVLFGPQGNGILPTWADVLLAFNVLWNLLEAAGRVEGAWAFTSRVLHTARDRIGQGRDAIEKRHITWEQRGATPLEIADLLGLGPWHEDDLAVRLDCEPREAKAILWSHGYEKAPSGLGGEMRTKQPVFCTHS